MALNSDWWADRVAKMAAATSSRTSPKPDFALALDMGEAALTQSHFDATVDDAATMADDQDLKAAQRAAWQAAARVSQATTEAQASKSEDKPWWKDAIDAAGGFFGKLGDGFKHFRAGQVAAPQMLVADTPEEKGEAYGKAVEGQEKIDEKLDQAYQFVDQVVATPFVAATMADAENWNLGEVWELAGDDLTAGQAVTDIFAGGKDADDWYRAGFDEMGRPRDAAYAELRENSFWYNATSGTLDFAKAWYLDPTVVAGKGASLTRAHLRGDFANLGAGSRARVKNIVAATDEELSGIWVPRLDLVGQNALRLRGRMDALRDEVRAGNRDVVSLVEGELAFRDSPDAAALFVQASKAKKIDPETGRILDEFDDELYRDFVGASMGRGTAIHRLAVRNAEGSDLASSIDALRTTQIPELEALASKSADVYDDIRTDPNLSSYQRYDRAMRAERTLAEKVDAAELAREQLSRFEGHQDYLWRAQQRTFDQIRAVPGTGKSVTQTGFDVVSSTWRPGRLSQDAQTYTKVSPSMLRRRPGAVDLHRPDDLYQSMDRYFESMGAYGGPTGIRKFLEDNPEIESFDALRRDMLNSAANATSDTQRLRIAHEMEDVGVAVVAAKHGLTTDEALEVLSHVRGRREDLFANIVSRHQDQGSTIGKFEIKDGAGVETIDLELTLTQLQNTFLATDLRAMDGFLGQHSRAIGTSLRDAARHRADQVGEKATAALEKYNSFWKPMTLLRLGYPLRTVSDDFLRGLAMADQGVRMVAATPKAAAVGFANAVPRTANIMRAPFRARARRQWEDRNADVVRGIPAEWGDVDPTRMSAIESRVADVDTVRRSNLNAQANGKKPAAKNALAAKLDRALADENVSELAIDVASGRRLRANVEVFDFGLSRAQLFDKKPSGIELARFSRDNADRLSHPDGVLAVTKTPEGWRVTVGRKGPGYRKLQTLKQTPLTKGVVVGRHDFEAFGEPGHGDAFVPLASSGPAWRGVIKSHESNVAMFREKAMSEGRVTTPKDGLAHAQTWASVVNKYYRQDPVVRRLIELGPDETVKWLRNTPEGRAVARRLPHKSHDAVKWTDGLMNDLNLLLPDEALRAKVARGDELTPDELLARMNTTPDDVPAAIDALRHDLSTGAGYFGQQQRGLVDRIYHVLATLPTDTLARHPFIRDQYAARLRDATRTLDDSLLDADGLIPEATRKLMERQAREHALKQARRYMFSLTDNTDMVHTMRFLSPFMGAWQETMIRWGTLLMERPHNVARVWAQGWENVEELWFLDMVDERGLGEDDPDHGDLTNIRMPVPKWFSKNVLAKLYGDEAAELVHSVNISKEGMNAILQGSPWWLPGGGPVLQFPAAALLKGSPHLADENAFTAFMWKYLFPTGVPDNVDAVLPAGWQAQAFRWVQGMDDPVFMTLASNVHKLDVSRWEAEGRIGPRPTESEAVDKAKSIQAVMVAGRFVSPSSFQIEVGDPNSPVPAQFFIDQARRIQAEEPDFNKALERYVTEFGDDAYHWWSSTSKSKTDIAATSQAFKSTEQYEKLISDFPDVGIAVVGLHNMQGTFNYNVYAEQQRRGDRERLTPAEAQARAESQAGWAKWMHLSEGIDAELAARGLTSLNQKGAEDLRNIKQYTQMQLGQTYPGWARDREQFDLGRGYDIVRALRTIVESDTGPDPASRPDWAGVAEYLEVHDGMAEELDVRAMSNGSRDITAASNADLKAIFDFAVGQITLSNPMFADLYHRLLERHELTNGSN